MERIATLVQRLEDEVEPAQVREDARELVREVLAFHAEGLRRLVSVIDRHDPAVLFEALADPLIESLLDLHAIERPRAPQRESGDSALVPASKLLRLVGHRSADKMDSAHDDDSRCDFCGEPAGARHAHLLDVQSRALSCACVACKLVLASNGSGRYRQVPDDAFRLALSKDNAWWADLGLPVGLAFFVMRGDRSSATAHYPGPAGTTESTLPVEAWSAFIASHPELARMEPDVHALLVDRSNGASEHWVVGIDRCYELVERLRRHWRGMTGGEEAREELRRFFAELARTGVTHEARAPEGRTVS